MKTIQINQSSPPNAAVQVKVCDTFVSKLAGLMFAKDLAHDHGVLFVEKKASRINTAIHMLFMNFDLTVLWLDQHQVIVDKVLAKKWVPFYCSKKPANYVVELHAAQYPEFAIGDKLKFVL